MALDKQINLFKVDTNAFLTQDEKNRRKYLIKLKKVREKVRKRLPKYSKKLKDEFETEKAIILHKRDKSEELEKYEKYWLIFDDLIKCEESECKKYIIANSERLILYNETNPDNKTLRELDERYLSYIDTNGEKHINVSNVISMFESTLSRSFNIATNELTYDIFILQIYYYGIAKDLIVNGFNYNGKHYVYFSSSAGQIRTKKAVFVEEEKYNACRNKLTCGLTVDAINNKGGMNINKYLAYLALANSATEPWKEVFGKEFDIDRCIVVKDFETDVECVVDNIDYETYEITEGVKQKMPIPHTDGCGMISSNYSKKNFMVRLPFIKGLLGSFDFVRFINENNCSPIVKDMWGDEHNIIDENIEIIFTKSQLKMAGYYESWDDYKFNFKKYNCEAGVCNMEEDKISDAKINYQMLQTLYKATDEDIKELCEVSNNKIKNVCASVENALEFFGVDLDNEYERNKDYYQRSLRIYPELLSDPSAREDLRDLKNSLVKRYRGAHIDVFGKFTFVLPDLYAFCEWLFCGINIPLGLLENEEVYCRLYKQYDKLDCLRSPHLYIEHAVRKNVCQKKYRNQWLAEWFTTDAIYTSTYDLISRILQFDVDGDRLLVIAQKKIIELAEDHMTGVNPLYYEMKKAKAELITPNNLYNGLEKAFTGGKIGGISNDITKIWNGKQIDDAAKKAVRWLCMETNFTIDYAKTLFKPTRPDDVDEILKAYGKDKVPYFFQFAKDKAKKQCEEINDSVINRISKAIIDPKNMFKPIKDLSPLNYKMLIKDMSDNYSNDTINSIFDLWNKKYGNNVKLNEDSDNQKNNLLEIAKEVKADLNKIEPDDQKVINSLARFLYKKKSSRKKKLLWYIYGEQLHSNIVENLAVTELDKKNICHCCGKRVDNLVDGKCDSCRKNERETHFGSQVIKCIDCGKEFEVGAKSRRKCRCDDCQKMHIKEYDRQRKQAKLKSSVIQN